MLKRLQKRRLDGSKRYITLDDFSADELIGTSTASLEPRRRVGAVG